MRIIHRTPCVILTAALLLAAFSGCHETAVDHTGDAPAYTSYRDIPGVTAEEISAIEALRARTDHFVYGMTESSEAYQGETGEIAGYSALLCGWLTDIFDIPFQPVIYEWGDLLAGLETLEISFTGDLATTVEHLDNYFLADAVAEHTLCTFRIPGGRPLSAIAAERPLRYAFFEHSGVNDMVAEMINDSFESSFVTTYTEAYGLLKSGAVDAFVFKDLAEAAFRRYGEVEVKGFVPLIYVPYSMMTQNPELQPVISVTQKAMQNDGARNLIQLHTRGKQEYSRHHLLSRLTGEERAYLHDHPVVHYVAEYDNYPVSFYNEREKQWQGIAFDVLGEVEMLTGLSFERVNDHETDWPALLKMLSDGEASMILDLEYAKDWEGRFLWPETPVMTDSYALLSRSDFPNLRLTDILSVKVGLVRDSAFAELFRTWFPYYANAVEYDSFADVYNALDRGKVDMVMASQLRMLYLTHYMELAGYKINTQFDQTFDSTFGFNREEKILCSIIDKTLRQIDVQSISGQWTSKNYDYRFKLAQAQRPWLIGGALLLLCLLVLLFVFLRRKSLEGKRLEELVRSRTEELEKQYGFMAMVNETATLLLSPDTDDYMGVMNRSMGMIGGLLEVDQVYIWQNFPKEDGRLWFRRVCKWRGESAENNFLPEYAYEDVLPGIFDIFSRKETVNALAADFPEADRLFVTSHGIQSVLAVPLFLADTFWGVVTIADCRKQRVFDERYVGVLRSWGLLAVNAFQRSEASRNMKNTLTKLDAVLGNYRGIIWSIDGDGVITTFRGRYLEKLGILPADIQGRHFKAVPDRYKLPDISERVEKTFREGTQDWIAEIDGKMYQYHTTPMYDDKGQTIGIVGSTDEVTERIMLQRELETALKNAEMANQSKSTFLATMSHEIRSPMNAILGITEILLQGGGLSEETIAALTKIHNSGGLLIGIINDILDLSKIEAGKLELTPDKYEVASLITDTANLNMLRFESKPVDFELRVDETLPSELFGDELRIKQVLNNLISNAAKYTDRGQVVFSVAAEPAYGAAHPDVTLVLQVRDTGRGMTEDQVNKLFDEYTRFTSKANRTTEGTGLGMSITRNLVGLMSGEISVRSRVGEGTEFTVRLPQGDVGAAALGHDVAENLRQFRMNRTPRIKNARIVRERMPYGRVLVVDDMETNIYVAKGLMLPYELKIDSADSGFEAIDKIRDGEVYDIIFMDHMMPNLDGIEATKIIRDLGYTRPIVALTANAVAGQADIFMRNGFDAFISKPIDMRQLNAVLNKLIRDKHPREAAETVSLQDAVPAASIDEPQVKIDPQMAASCVRDMTKAAAVLEAAYKDGFADDESVAMYTVNAHAMKSVLANIGETELSRTALNLEKAGRGRELAVLSADTPAFLDALRTVITKIAPEDETGDDSLSGGMSDADEALLREKMRVIQAACEVYDNKAAEDALAGLKQKAWPRRNRELLERISEHLLHSDFEEAASAARDCANTANIV